MDTLDKIRFWFYTIGMSKKEKESAFYQFPKSKREERRIAAAIAKHRSKNPRTPQQKSNAGLLQLQYLLEDHLKKYGEHYTEEEHETLKQIHGMFIKLTNKYIFNPLAEEKLNKPANNNNHE